jgi:hypothetical protein
VDGSDSEIVIPSDQCSRGRVKSEGFAGHECTGPEVIYLVLGTDNMPAKASSCRCFLKALESVGPRFDANLGADEKCYSVMSEVGYMVYGYRVSFSVIPIAAVSNLRWSFGDWATAHHSLMRSGYRG